MKNVCCFSRKIVLLTLCFFAGRSQACSPELFMQRSAEYREDIDHRLKVVGRLVEDVQILAGRIRQLAQSDTPDAIAMRELLYKRYLKKLKVTRRLVHPATVEEQLRRSDEIVKTLLQNWSKISFGNQTAYGDITWALEDFIYVFEQMIRQIDLFQGLWSQHISPQVVDPMKSSALHDAWYWVTKRSLDKIRAISHATIECCERSIERAYWD